MNRVLTTTIGDINDISGFFQKYNTINNTHFVSLFENATESDIETLDYLLSDVFGGKVLIQKYADIFEKSGADVLMNRIVSIADKYFYTNWLSFKQSIDVAINSNLSKPLESEKIIESQKTGKNETQNKLNAFDGSLASDTDSADNSYTDNFSTRETNHYSNGKIPAVNAEEQIDFVKNNDLIELILNDVVSICCLDIYDENYTCSRTSGGSGGSDPAFESRIIQCENDITDIKKIIPETATEQNKLATIADVQSGYDDTELRGRIETVENSIPDVSGLANKQELQAINNLIPSNASSQNKLATIADVPSGYDDTELRGRIETVENSIPDVSGLANKQELQAINNLIPSNASSQNKLATIADVPSGYDDTELRGRIETVENSIPDVSGLANKQELQAINNLIPSNASSQNKLATMADIGGSGGGGGGGSYYTVGQEVDTGNVYKDGSTEKPIYRTVINVSSVTHDSDVDVNRSFAGATRFINITGSYNLNGARHGLGYYYAGGTKGVQAEVSLSRVRISVMGSGLTFKDITIIIEYIK